MKSFRTELMISPASFSLQPSDRIVTLGSCFSDSIGSLLHVHKFNTTSNPLGILYSPLAIHKAVVSAATNSAVLPSAFVERDGIWSHFDFHSCFSAASRTQAEKNISDAISAAYHALTTASCIMITYGTAWIFRRKNTMDAVASCHKLPAKDFTKDLLTAEAFDESFDEMLCAIKRINHSAKLILTVSPVRHIKDTPILNSVSKSMLRLSVHRILERHPEINYFPAYEIMLDDLRDYRFYSSDMLHPSADAIQYIWEKFSAAYFSSATRQLLQEWTSVRAALDHKPFHAGSDGHQKFLRDTLARLEELKPAISVDEEVKQIRALLV